MSKIICDICGTSYADTAEQCPICGCVRPAQTTAVPDEGTQGGYTHVKGGRFSKSNVKKRASASAKPENDSNNKGKKGLIILLIALALVCVLGVTIALFATGAVSWALDSISTIFDFNSVPNTTPAPTDPPEPIDIPCEGLSVKDAQYTLQNIGDTLIIHCTKVPETSTDEISFVSENEAVATVDQNGVVTAVQNGITNIIICCGNVETSCQITVGNGSVAVLELSETSIVLTQVGESKTIYTGAIPAADISWETSNEYIATVRNGVVTAVASGPVTITATYMDQVVTCDVLCDIDYSGSSGGITEDGGNGGITEDGGNGGITEDGGNAATPVELVTWDDLGPLTYKNDTTLPVGKSATLYLGNSDGTGERIAVNWTCNANDYITVSGNTVKAVKSNNSYPITLSTEYEGKVYKCIIRTCLP